MLVTTSAIVISSLKYGEADLIVKCYTRSDGLKSYLLRRILKSKKGKLRTAMFQPLTQLEIVANHKNQGTLESIREAKLILHYKTLHTDVVKTTVVLFLSEILKSAIQEEEANPALYEYLVKAFNWMDGHGDIANFHLLFLLHLTRYLGFYPDDSQSHLESFHLELGQFVEPDTSPLTLGTSETAMLKDFLGINFDALPSIKLNQEKRARLVSVLIDYYTLHLYGFKKPRSLAVLQKIFN